MMSEANTVRTTVPSWRPVGRLGASLCPLVSFGLYERQQVKSKYIRMFSHNDEGTAAVRAPVDAEGLHIALNVLVSQGQQGSPHSVGGQTYVL